VTADDMNNIVDIIAMTTFTGMASTRSACWVI